LDFLTNTTCLVLIDSCGFAFHGHGRFFESFIYVAMAVALVSFAEFLWQYQNDFPVFHHMQLLAKTQLVNVERAGF